ncbi:MAG: bifunctional hydroxymethylpyrimidine kinase/phosphomethylpyrimidine kinase [Leptospiraceae bacterium]|nr:bifunctional hydroxymethylpyrimidine kinase/phosphomethylpyrimidine kinase [Leptospiraceae bacterium]
MAIPKALTIAGSDSGGGAGIQADLKTFFAHGVYGMSVITAVTAQNTQAVTAVEVFKGSFVLAQLEAVFSDLGVDAAKTGMLANAEIIETISDYLKNHKLKRLVVDPVMISKSGHPLLEQEASEALIKKLLPLALVATPNLFEAERVTGKKITSKDDMKEAAKFFFEIGVAFPIIKGGHLKDMPAVDILYDGKNFYEWESPRLTTKHTHGTGCTFSAAITALLSKGYEVPQAVEKAKHYITGAIATAPGLGHGFGPVNHFYNTGIPLE